MCMYSTVHCIQYTNSILENIWQIVNLLKEFFFLSISRVEQSAIDNLQRLDEEERLYVVDGDRNSQQVGTI